MIDLFLINPWFRVFIPLLLMGASNVSGNILATEIYSTERIEWELIPYKFSFYILLVSIIFLFIHQVFVASNDKKLAKGITPKQYEAAIRNKVAEDVAKRSKKLIRNGDIEKLEKETEMFKKLYGEDE